MSEKTLPMTGGCLCGAVRYEASEPPQKTLYCHCRMCQKTSGGPFEVSAFFRNETFRFTRGEAKLYRSSDIADRGFCENCGSRLIYRSIGGSLTGVDVGSLDHPGDVSPEYHTGVERQVPWLTIHDDLPRMRTEENPNIAALKAATEREEE